MIIRLQNPFSGVLKWIEPVIIKSEIPQSVKINRIDFTWIKIIVSVALNNSHGTLMRFKDVNFIQK